MNWMRERCPVFLMVMVLAAGVTIGSPHGFAADMPADGVPDLEQITVLDLPTAAKIALAGNPSLDVARARVEQAREAVGQSRSAYWPHLDLDFSGSRVDLSENALQSQMAMARVIYGPTAGVENPENYFSVGLTASWVLFDGFARKFNLAAARHGYQSAEAAREDTRRLLFQAVADAFLSAQLALESIAIAEADESFNQRLLTEAKLRYEVGTGALSDVLNFEVKANSAQAERIAAESNYQTARVGLAALLGLPQARLPGQMRLAELTPITTEELQVPAVDRLVDGAHRLRPDLQQNEWVVQQAQADVQAKRAGYFPTISVAASYTGETTEDVGFEGDDFGNTIGINLTYNIFAGGLYRAQHQQARARLREAEKVRDAARINVASEVRTATEKVLSAQKQLLLQRDNARLVQQNRDLVEKEYKAGVGSLVRLNEAQRDLTRAQVGLAVSRTALRQAWYDLQSVSGEIATSFDH